MELDRKQINKEISKIDSHLIYVKNKLFFIYYYFTRNLRK